ncbi:hypothetical protein [Pandoraea communis]|uniref:hypothetical protein n=1 Tax=Pandoraea communis TaxID=2508297 RepID=UPI0025A60931|nr:hypothetical protein [Pandoraea communis]MDM8358071.1 hypothetical protein [Pandoraea communis]
MDTHYWHLAGFGAMGLTAGTAAGGWYFVLLERNVAMLVAGSRVLAAVLFAARLAGISLVLLTLARFGGGAALLGAIPGLHLARHARLRWQLHRS